jgi:hypothetical protein
MPSGVHEKEFLLAGHQTTNGGIIFFYRGSKPKMF